jgi:hypothetical protein
LLRIRRDQIIALMASFGIAPGLWSADFVDAGRKVGVDAGRIRNGENPAEA